MLDKFLLYINDNKLTNKGQKILAAVSGGIDSMVMLNLLIESGMKPDIVHCNFKLRGAESNGDEKFVFDTIVLRNT